MKNCDTYISFLKLHRDALDSTLADWFRAQCILICFYMWFRICDCQMYLRYLNFPSWSLHIFVKQVQSTCQASTKQLRVSDKCLMELVVYPRMHWLNLGHIMLCFLDNIWFVVRFDGFSQGSSIHRQPPRHLITKIMYQIKLKQQGLHLLEDILFYNQEKRSGWCVSCHI